jgi:hypothetical protein
MKDVTLKVKFLIRRFSLMYFFKDPCARCNPDEVCQNGVCDCPPGNCGLMIEIV